MIEFKNVSLSLNKKLALKNLSWTINDGERWFVYGRREAEILASLLFGYLRNYAGQVNSFGFSPREGKSLYYKQVCFIPPYFPLTRMKGYQYLRCCRKIYPSLDIKKTGETLKALGIDENKSLRKLPPNKRKLFHIAAGLGRSPKLAVFQNLFHGLGGGDRRDIHNLLLNSENDKTKMVFYEGKLGDYRDIADNLAIFSQGILTGVCTTEEISRNLEIGFAKSRRFIKAKEFSVERLVAGWKTLSVKSSSSITPPDFGILEIWLNEGKEIPVSSGPDSPRGAEVKSLENGSGSE